MNRRLFNLLLSVITIVVVAAAAVSGLAVGFGMNANNFVLAAVMIFMAASVGLFIWSSWPSWSWWIWHRRMGKWLARREALISQGRCPSCAYDLTGNVSGTCPECGTAIHE